MIDEQVKLISDLDIKLIGGQFLFAPLPQEKLWMEKYLDAQGKKFLKYWLVFYDQKMTFSRLFSNFMDHTGKFYPEMKLYKYNSLIRKLDKAFKKAESEKDLETLTKLKSGDYKV